MKNFVSGPSALFMCLAIFALTMPGAIAAKKQVINHPRVVHRVRVAHPRKLVVRYGPGDLRQPQPVMVHPARHGRGAVVVHPLHPPRHRGFVVLPTPVTVTPDWAVAKRPGDANWVREAPNHGAKIIEKVMQGTRLHVIGQAPDPFGTVYFHVALPDGKVGWLDHVCVRFVR